MSLKNFEIIEEIGKGAFGTVYKVKRILDNNIYALKKVPMNLLNGKEKENTLNEIRFLASINNPNVISFKDSFYDENQNIICIVMEYADNGDLEDKINNNIKYKLHFSETEIWEIFLQIVNGIKALHDKKIMHRDLKCANILLTKKKEIKIADMNVSKMLKIGVLNTQTGTPYYASPEVWKEKPYDYKSDIWSLGCILYEMCTLKPPFRADTLEHLYKKVIKGVYENIPVIYSREMKNMIANLLQINPNNRPNIDKIQTLLDIQIKTSLVDFKNFKKEVENSEKFDILKTIRLPRKLKEINRMLPKSNYESVDSNYIIRLNSLNKPVDNSLYIATDNKNCRELIRDIQSSALNNRKITQLSKEERLLIIKNAREKRNKYSLQGNIYDKDLSNSKSPKDNKLSVNLNNMNVNCNSSSNNLELYVINNQLGEESTDNTQNKLKELKIMKLKEKYKESVTKSKSNSSSIESGINCNEIMMISVDKNENTSKQQRKVLHSAIINQKNNIDKSDKRDIDNILPFIYHKNIIPKSGLKNMKTIEKNREKNIHVKYSTNVPKNSVEIENINNLSTNGNSSLDGKYKNCNIRMNLIRNKEMKEITKIDSNLK